MNRKYRKTIIAANWKMNLLASDVGEFADELLSLVPDFHKWCKVVICAPFTSLTAVSGAFKNSRVAAGAQNLSQYDSGAYTGEISGAQLHDLGVKYVIIGHSERRGYFGETDDMVNKKIHSALKNSLSPIVCVGETLTQRELGVTNELVSMQVKAALYGVDTVDLNRIVIAYEPVWAIGTGRTATPLDAQDVCGNIRAVVRSLFGPKAARALSVLYGGSMNEGNAYDLLAEPDIDGGLIGGASLKPTSLAAIINAADQKT